MEIRLFVLALCLSPMVSAARADIFEPFSTSNLNPFVQLHGQPATRSARLTESGRLNWQVRSDIANNFTRSTRGTESIVLDGETWRTTISLNYGFADNWEIGLELPYIRHDGGSLDSFIENWHGWFGLPNGGRDSVSQNRLIYRWDDGVTTLLDRQSSASGWGDASLHLAFGWARDQSDWAIRAGVKLQTGDADRLTGTDGTDVFTSVHLTQENVFNQSSLTFHGNLGVLKVGSGGISPDRRKDWVTFGSAGLVWQPAKRWERLSLKSQLDFNSAYYTSDLREPGDHSLQLVVGGSVQITPTLVLDVGVVEDIVTDTSPDVVFHLGLRSRL